MGTYVELPEKLQKKSLINIKNKDDFVLFGLISDILILKNEIQIESN